MLLICLDIPLVIMLEAGLSDLNRGIKPPSPSWGKTLSAGYTSLRSAPHVVIVAGIPLVQATLGFTFLGEGLCDVLDARSAGRRWTR